MAGIEKICELTGEYPSYGMYDFKRNQLQIMPSCRKLFRGVDAVLYVSFDEYRFAWRSSSTSYDKEQMNWYDPVFTSEREFIQYKKEVEGQRLIKRYDYVLHVKDEALQGNVNGKFYNCTNHLPTVFRKMKRLLRTRNLKVVFVDGDLHEHMKGVG